MVQLVELKMKDAIGILDKGEDEDHHKKISFVYCRKIGNGRSGSGGEDR